jgi:hypothetical protein
MSQTWRSKGDAEGMSKGMWEKETGIPLKCELRRDMNWFRNAGVSMG